MKRKCPNCGEKKVPILMLALLGEASRLRCGNCHCKIEVSQLLSVVSFYVINVLMIVFLFFMVEILGIWGVPVAFVAWFSAEVVRSIYLPLKAIVDG